MRQWVNELTVGSRGVMGSAQGTLRQTLLTLQGMQDVADLVLDFGVFVYARLELFKDGGGDETGGHFGGLVGGVQVWWLCEGVGEGVK